MVFLKLLSIYITFLRMVEVRLERAGERIGERRLRSNKVIELREEPQKKEQKKRASKISLQSSLSKRRRPPTLPHCIAVPSAQTGLTSLFGMGRGGTPTQ